MKSRSSKVESILEIARDLLFIFVPVFFVVMGVFTEDTNKATMLISGGLGSFGTLLKAPQNKEFFDDKLEINERENK
jgi:hypothetical protein